MSCGNIAANPDTTTRVARFARAVAGGFAAHAVDAEAAQAGAIATTHLTNLVVTIRADVAGARAAARSVLRADGNIGAGPDCACNIACAARRGARGVATNAIDAKRGHAFGSAAACSAERFLARAIAIACIVAIDAACRIDGRRRVRRIALRAAQVLRARVAIDGFVVHVDGGHDIPRSIAFENFAVACRLPLGQIGARCRVRKTALIVVARARLAKVVRAHAVASDVAPDAHARCIAHETIAARGILWLGWIRWSAIRAKIHCARIAIVRQIRVIGNRRRPASAVANHFLAIAWRLQRGARKRFLPHVQGLALVVHAIALRALVLDDAHAMHGKGAFDTCAVAIAHAGLARRARNVRALIWMARHAIHTNIHRARLAVIRRVGIVVDERILSARANLDLAIAHDFRGPRCGHSIEVRIDALARRGIAKVIGARKAVVTRVVRIARNLARPRFARSNGFPYHAGRTVRKNRVSRYARRTTVSRTRLEVVFDIGVIVGR